MNFLKFFSKFATRASLWFIQRYTSKKFVDVVAGVLALSCLSLIYGAYWQADEPTYFLDLGLIYVGLYCISFLSLTAYLVSEAKDKHLYKHAMPLMLTSVVRIGDLIQNALFTPNSPIPAATTAYASSLHAIVVTLIACVGHFENVQKATEKVLKDDRKRE